MPGTTSLSKLPYALGTEPVKDGAKAMQNLAEALDKPAFQWACYALSSTTQNFVSDGNLRINNLTTLARHINCPALIPLSGPSNSAIPITVNGWYLYEAMCAWGTSVVGVGARGLALHSVNQNAFLTAETLTTVAAIDPTTGRQQVRGSGVIYLGAGDQIRMGVWQTSGATAAAGNNFLKLSLVNVA